MTFTVQDFLSFQSQVKHPGAKGTSSKGQQDGTQGLAQGDSQSGGFQQMVEDVVGQAKCSHEGTSCQGKLQADPEPSAEERIVSRLQEMGISDEDIPKILEQLTEPSLGSLLVAAYMRQGQSPEIPVSEGDCIESVVKGGHEGDPNALETSVAEALLPGKAGSNSWIETAAAQDGKILLQRLATQEKNLTGKEQQAACPLQELLAGLTTKNGDELSRDIQELVSGRLSGKLGNTHLDHQHVPNDLKTGRGELRQGLENILSKLTSGNNERMPAVQELLSSLKADTGEPAQVFAKLTAEQQQGLQELLSRVRAEQRPSLQDIQDVKVGPKGPMATTGFEKLQRTAGLDDQSPVEAGRINGKEGLQQIVSRLKGLTSNLTTENHNDSALRFDMPHARNGHPSDRRDFGELPPLRPGQGPQSTGTANDSERMPFGRHAGNHVQISQEGSQENGRGLFNQNESSLGKDRPGQDALRFLSNGTGKGAGSLFENTTHPSQAQPPQGVQQMSPSHLQAKQTAMPFPQQQPMESNVLNQVFVRLVSGIRQGSRSMVINMHPPELGRVKVSLVSDSGRLSAVLHTENQQVQGVLDRHLPQLRQSLQEQGVAIADLGVSLDSGGQEGQSAFEEQKSRLAHGKTAGPVVDEAMEKESDSSFIQRGPYSSDQGLNIRV